MPAVLRVGADGTPFVTDDGLYIVDLPFGEITDPADMEAKLNNIPGVAACGLFVGMASRLLIGHEDGTVSEPYERKPGGLTSTPPR